MPKVQVYRISYKVITSHQKNILENGFSKIFCSTSSIGVTWYISLRPKQITIKARCGCGGDHYLSPNFRKPSMYAQQYFVINRNIKTIGKIQKSNNKIKLLIVLIVSELTL